MTRPLTDILSDIAAHGYRVSQLCQIKGGWHAQIGPWGEQTNGRDRILGRGASIEDALQAAWIAGQKLLPKIQQVGETGVIEPQQVDIEEAIAAAATGTDELEDVLG